MPHTISNPEFGFEQDIKAIQCTKSKLGQWNIFFVINYIKTVAWVLSSIDATPPNT